MKRILTLTILLLSSFALNAQLVTSISGATNLVQNVLLGSGVTVSNISYNGASVALGSFTANGTNLGINSGVVITTGTILNNGSGPHGPNNQENAGFDNGFGGNGILQNIVGNSTHNAAVLEFDLVPYSDEVRFKYVFGSEEYLEFVGSQFNDLFGFFIAGPGIVPDPGTGGYKNIARLPNGQTVAINNVHSATTNPYGTFGAANGAFYVNNAGGGSIEYDGFTTPLEAVSQVQCGETYHLKIIIADVGDPDWDSGIFLEANSLNSKTPVEIDHVLSWEAYDDPDLMAEGCVSATFTLTRENNLDQALVIPITMSGTATEGVDYSNIPNAVTFAPGQTQIQFSLDAFADGVTEGLENLIFEFGLIDPCGNATPIFVELAIQDVEPLVVTVNDDEVVCAGDFATLTADTEGGVGPFDLVWTTGETTETITVSPTTTQTYTVTVTDQCTQDVAQGSGTVAVPVYQPMTYNITADITEICPYLPADLEVNVEGGAGHYTFQWTSDQGQVLGTDSIQNVIPSQTTLYTVTITDLCGEQITADVLYTITSPPLVVTISPDIEICPGDSVLLQSSAVGGYGLHYFVWPHSGETTQDVWVNPYQTTDYMVVVSDECQTFSVPAITTVIVIKPTANFQVSSQTLFNDLPITFQNLSLNATTYEWDFGDGNTSTMVHPNNTYDEPGTYVVTLIATDDKGCKDTIQKSITILEEFYIYVPNTFTPDNDRLNNDFEVSTVGINTFDIKIFNRWGELIFTSSDPRFKWDGTHNGKLIQDGTFTYVINYLALNGMEGKLYGHVNLLK